MVIDVGVAVAEVALEEAAVADDAATAVVDMVCFVVVAIGVALVTVTVGRVNDVVTGGRVVILVVVMLSLAEVTVAVGRSVVDAFVVAGGARLVVVAVEFVRHTAV